MGPSSGGRDDGPTPIRGVRDVERGAEVPAPDAPSPEAGPTSALDALDDLDEAALRDEEARHVIFCYRILPASGQVFLSPSVEGISGYTADDFYADPFLAYSVIHPEDLPVLLQLHAEHDANRPIVLRWVRRDRKVIWTRHLHAPVHDETGQVIAVEGVAQDITQSVLEELGIEQPELPRTAVSFDGSAPTSPLRRPARKGPQPQR